LLGNKKTVLGITDNDWGAKVRVISQSKQALLE